MPGVVVANTPGVVPTDPVTGYEAKVDASGRLLVATPEPAVPPGTTGINVSAIGAVNGNGFLDSIHTITNGKTLTIQRLAGGAEDSRKDSKVSLLEDPNGDLSVLNLIRVAYLTGSNFEFSLNVQFVGDGTRRIVLRRERLDGGQREVAGFLDGFEQ